MLQLARLVERVDRNFDERWLTGAILLDVAKAFNTVWVKGLLYQLTVLNFPSFLLKTILSYFDCRTFQTSFQSATSTCHGMRAGVAQDGLFSPVQFSLCVNDIHIPSRHIVLAQCAEDTALAAMSRIPLLLVGYLEAYFGRLEQRWLRVLRIAITVSRSTAVQYVKTARHIQKPRAVQFLGEPI
jgi:hypothetical protein